MIRLEAKDIDEDWVLLSLENMTARVQWLPYIRKIRKLNKPVFLDYGKDNYLLNQRTLQTLEYELRNAG